MNPKTPEYASWDSMKSRCLNPNSEVYSYYGERGISICQAWIDSFEAFYRDMGPRPTPKHTLERIDNEKGYEPGNCKWATRAEQARNRRPTRRYTIDGETLCARDWAIRYGIPNSTVSRRLVRGLTIEQALGLEP